jgi:Ser/Thr protein kinase RdoA (MazF antagonist)
MAFDPIIPVKFAEQTLSQFAIQSTKSFAGGLSGARVWKCQSSLFGALCLRQWSPTHPTQDRLQFIHNALEHANERLAFIPRVLRDQTGKSFWFVSDCLWEVTQWMPGQANYIRQPSQAKLNSATDALAELHAVWCEFAPEQGLSPTTTQRISVLDEWLGTHDLVERVGAQVRGPIEAAACMSTIRMLHSRGPRLLDELRRANEVQVRLHPVLRDIWSDHLLFEGDRVSGIIDFGTVRMDEPAADLSRMLGSLHPFELDVRLAAIEAYNRRRTAHAVDAERVELLDRTGTLLTALQWMRWLILERQKFNADTAVLFERWQTALARMMGESLVISAE